MSARKPTEEASSPSMRMMQLLWPGAMTVQAIYVAASLKLADMVAGGAKTAEELAAATKTHAPRMTRLMRALTSLGIFEEDGEGSFRQTELSDTLRSDRTGSSRPLAMMLGAEFFWRPMGALQDAVRTGRPSFDQLYGTSFFEYLDKHPADAAIFNAAMSSSPEYLTAVIGAYSFSNMKRIVDVGGGHGLLLATILSANPKLRGVLYDLPPVVEGASVLRKEPLNERCGIVGGDFFNEVPAGADGYILKGVIHDWSDEAALKILKNCRKAIRADGSLLLVENVLTKSSGPANAMMDMLMMVLTTGKERTAPEFRTLLEAAGFALVRTISAAGISILESRPI